MHKPGWVCHALLLCCSLVLPVVAGSQPADPAASTTTNTETTLPRVINLEDIQWGPPGGGNGVPLGVRTAQQGVDPVSGGVTYFALFPAGTRFEPHWHTYDEFVSVVSGSVVIELGGETHALQPGAYIVIPGSMVHSWIMPDAEDVIILVRRAGPADFNFVDQ